MKKISTPMALLSPRPSLCEAEAAVATAINTARSTMLAAMTGRSSVPQTATIVKSSISPITVSISVRTTMLLPSEAASVSHKAAPTSRKTIKKVKQYLMSSAMVTSRL